ncbi:MAG: DUF2283 domain-containing protein [Opitutus sp.]|nr:DUF2283 domain-containing protein [Opitutus sp.]MCS6275716.1 DUF2283 domain-containing protein [Opitutus sp.]MCS6300813.1 DUF2283 domain-containing protein [Opitutus sp.]
MTPPIPSAFSCPFVFVDLDASGRLVSMTIEHAKTSASIRDFSFEELLAS